MKLKSVYLFVVIYMIMLSLSNDISADTMYYIYTPNNTLVYVWIREEMSEEDIEDANQGFQDEYPDAELIGDASNTYNCHGYAWYVSEGCSKVWIEAPEQTKFWADSSYVSAASEAMASKVSFNSADHSAVTTCESGVYISKWGSGPLMKHNAGSSPYDNSDVAYFKSNDPAASVSGFYVSEGVAHWKVTSEYKTSGYRIDGALSGFGPWEEITSVPAGIGNRTAAVGGNVTAYRLVELEESGRALICGVVKPGSGEAPPKNDAPTAADLRKKLAVLARMRERDGSLKGNSATMGEGEKYVIFTADSLIDVVDTYVADYWRAVGYSVVVSSVDAYPSDPDSFRAALRDTISGYAGDGAMYFHLIGDANDWQQFSTPWPGEWEQIRQDYLSSGYPPGGQPEKDLIPTWSYPDTLPRNMCTSYYVPYTLTDKPYSDTDGDGIPDVVVTRWPVNTEADVLALAYKMQSYMDYGISATEYRILTCVGDVDHMEEGDGAYARSVADTIIAALPACQDTVFLYESDCPIDGERNTAVANLWNDVGPQLVLLPSSYSNRSWPGNFFKRAGTSNPFHMDMLENGYPAVVFGLTCDTGDFARTEDPDYGKPVFERFLVEENKGAIAWIGPVLGSWQRGNKVLGKYFMEELYSDLSRPVAESFLIAQQRVYQDYPDDMGLLRTVDMYAFLGHPLLRLYKEAIVTDAESDKMPVVVSLGQNYPNPFNPATIIEFSINRGGHVELVVYDVAGRKIREIMNEEMDAGHHRIIWDAKNENGLAVASGIYFYQLKALGKVMCNKMVLLR